jgi:hypothetical protein
MFLVLALIIVGVTFEAVSDREPVQLQDQQRDYERDHSGNKGK